MLKINHKNFFSMVDNLEFKNKLMYLLNSLKKIKRR